MSMDGGLRDVVRAARAMGDTTACPTLDEIAAFYLDDLPPPRAELVRDHVASCRDCLEIARDASAFRACLADRSDAVGVLPQRMRWLAVAAALLVVVGGIALLFEANRPDAAAVVAHLDLGKSVYVPAAGGLLFRGDDDGGAAAAFASAMEPYQRDQFTEAARRLRTYVALEPDDERARLYLGVSLLRSGDLPGASAALGEASNALDPWVRGEALYYGAVALAGQGRTDLAMPLLVELARSSHGRAHQAHELRESLGSR